MKLLQMSFSGAVFAAAVVLIRTAAGGRLPKRTFPILWELVLARLLLPFSIPFQFSVYSLISAFFGTKTGRVVPAVTQELLGAVRPQLSADTVQSFSGWLALWRIGSALLALFFALSYLRCLREFRISFPVRVPYVEHWLQEHPLRRSLSIRQSDRISAPLTYGMIRPVILMPKKTDWQDETQLQYILLHEYLHIRRFDTVRKLITISALCVHWFNPMVWLVYVLFNRDMELSCDERVIQTTGEASKSAYALTLIGMEAKKSGLTPLCNNFNSNPIEERITAIMKTKKATVVTTILSGLLVLGTACVFGTSAAASDTGADITFVKNTASEVTVIDSDSASTVTTINSDSAAKEAYTVFVTVPDTLGEGDYTVSVYDAETENKANPTSYTVSGNAELTIDGENKIMIITINNDTGECITLFTSPQEAESDAR